MTEFEQTQHGLAMCLNTMISDLDEICALASQPETARLVDGERIAIGQVLTRVQLIASFINQRGPGLRMISHV